VYKAALICGTSGSTLNYKIQRTTWELANTIRYNK